MATKNRKFKSRNPNRVKRRFYFNKDGHLVRSYNYEHEFTLLSDTMQSENGSIFERNIAEAIEFSDSTFLQNIEETLFKDDDLAFVFENTPIVNNQGVALNPEDRRDAYRLAIHMAADDAAREVLTNQNDQFSPDEFKSRVKANTINRLGILREEALRIKQEKEKSSFFGKVMHNFAKRIPVKGQAITNMFEKAKQHMDKFKDKISQNVSPVKEKALWNKYVTKAATGFAALLFVGCGNGQVKAPVAQDTIKTTPVKQPVLLAQQVQEEATTKTDSVFVAPYDKHNPLHVWCENTFVSIGGWVGINQKLTDDFMKQHFDGKTRHEFLNAMRFADSKPSWEVAHSDAYRVTRQLIQYFNPCEGKTVDFPQNADAIFISQFKGDKNIQVIGSNPCDDTKQIKTLKATRIKNPAVQQTQDYEEVDDFVEVTEEIMDSVQTITPSFTSSSVNIQSNTVKVDQTINGSINVKEFIGNGQDGQITDASLVKDSADLSGVKIPDKNVLASSSFTSFADSTATTSALANVTDTTSVAANYQSTNTVDVSPVKSNMQNNTTDSLSQTVAEVAQSVEKVNISVTKAENEVTDSVKIVFDNDSLEIGTPGAGYVAERGGYNNSGITEKNYATLVKTYGQEKIDQFKQNYQASWAAKGGIFEGLTAEEAFFMTDALAGYNKETKAAAEAIFQYACDGVDSIPENIAQNIKTYVDLVRENHTIEGMPYNKATRVTGVDVDCGDVAVHTAHAPAARSSVGGGEEFPRLFAMPIKRTPAFDGISGAKLETDTVTITPETMGEITYSRYMANGKDGQFTDAKKTGSAEFSDIQKAAGKNDGKSVLSINSKSIKNKNNSKNYGNLLKKYGITRNG